MRQPNTVVVLSDYGCVNGGGAQVTLASVRGLLAVGLRVVLIYGVGPLDCQIDSNHPNLELHDLKLYDLRGDPSKIRSAALGVWKPRASRAIGEILKTLDPVTTVVHLHSWVQSLTASIVPEITRRGFPLVCTLHDYFAVCPNGGLYDYQKAMICEVKPMGVGCLLTHCDSASYGEKLWRYARSTVQGMIGGIPRLISDYIVVSDFSASVMKSHFPGHANFHLVNNPINIEQGLPSECASHADFTFVGRLSPEKGSVLFAQAARHEHIQSVFVGAGSEEETIRHANPKALLCGWIDRNSVIERLRSSRCLVFPSLWYETQGLVVLEAAALGIPSIVSDGCAARDFVVDGVTGLIFRGGDLNDLRQKLRSLRDDDACAARLGRNAYARYWDSPYTIEKHINSLLRVYGGMLGKLAMVQTACT